VGNKFASKTAQGCWRGCGIGYIYIQVDKSLAVLWRKMARPEHFFSILECVNNPEYLLIVFTLFPPGKIKTINNLMYLNGISVLA